MTAPQPSMRLARPATERRLSLRTSLLALVAACVVPVTLSALVLVVLHYEQGWKQVRQETLLEARGRAADLDREFARMIAGMRALAAAPELATGDLAGWQSRAMAAVPAQQVDNYLLTDAQGHQRANTLRPFGSPLPTGGTPRQLAAVFVTRKPVITDLFTGPVTGKPVMAIGVPVEVAGEVRYSLNIGLMPARFQALLQARTVPAGWVAVVLDSRGTVVARTRDPDRYIGQRVQSEVAAALANAPESTIETVTLDGVPVVSSFSRSSLSGWSVAVGAPKAQLAWHLRLLVGAACAGIAVATLAGLWLATRIGRQVLGAVNELNNAAGALVSGGAAQLPALRLREADAVGQALLEASEILQRTRHAAHHDPLTGMSNRALFDELLHRQIASARRRDGHFSVLALDLDDLKRINDSLGHPAGDEALRAAAHRILQSTRAADAAARLGGDEFAILLDGADEAEAEATASRLLCSLATPDERYPAPLGASIGVATWRGNGLNAGDLLEAADAALYAAKRSGKGRVHVSTLPTKEAAVVHR